MQAQVMLEDWHALFDSKVANDLEKFKFMSQATAANHYNAVLDDAQVKVSTKDLFRRD